MTSSVTNKQIAEIFKRSALHQTALWTLTSELQRKKLIWKNTKMETGQHIQHFAAEIIKSFMGYGYAVWKTSRKGKLLVADPEICTVARQSNGKWKVVSISLNSGSSRGWHCTVFVEPPLHVMNPQCGDWPSPTILSFPHYLRVVDIEQNWLRRDTHNSYPSVFTTIALDHFKYATTNAGQEVISTLPAPTFYRNADKYGEVGFLKSGGATDNTSSFSELAKKRHDAIRDLGSKSTLEREAIMSARDNGQAWDPQLQDGSTAPLHEEHIINDGKKAVETKILLSAADARFQYDRTRHAVLFALGVPPQAVGETVNSERTAASAAIYDVAIGLFLRTVEQYRKAVSDVLLQATTLDDGDYVEYSYGVSGIQLQRVMPLVKTSVAITLLSQTYNLPESFFDKSRVAAMQDADKPQPTGSTNGRKQQKGPQVQLETIAATPSQRGLNSQ